jgi:cell division cycle 20-like protein 1 (cofactor of APC complex)
VERGLAAMTTMGGVADVIAAMADRDAAEAVRAVRAYADRRMVGVEDDGRDAVAMDADGTAAEAKAKAKAPNAGLVAEEDWGFVTPPTSPSRRKVKESMRVVYSDRFVPSRAASIGFRGEFSMLDAEEEDGRLARDARDAATRRDATHATHAAGDGNVNADDNVTPHGAVANGAGAAAAASDREDTSAAYGALLRSELLGDVSPPEAYGITPPPTPSVARYQRASTSYSSPGRNLFRFQSDGVFGPSTPHASESPYSLSPVGAGDGTLGMTLLAPRRTPRKIARSPFKVLDAPALQDDFYLNLVDWSASNVLAVGLGTCVYLWSACTSKVTKLCELAPNDSVCSVAWTQRGTYLGVGTNSGEVQLWDVAKGKMTRAMHGHRSRAGTLAWNSHTLSSGSRDRTILNRDIRSPNDYSAKLVGHKSEVCGLKWSYDDCQLASGGNDNQLFIWNAHSSQPVLRCSEHTAAVKAIAWSPHQHGLLASGGGTADRCIRFWNTVTNSPLQCVDTGSQVCNLVWSKNVNEIVSTHGYSQNQIVVWRYPSMSKLATLTGHTLRVLFLSISPDGQTIVTGAGDETLRFWNVFPGVKSQVSGVGDNAVSSLARTSIR